MHVSFLFFQEFEETQVKTEDGPRVLCLIGKGIFTQCAGDSVHKTAWDGTFLWQP